MEEEGMKFMFQNIRQFSLTSHIIGKTEACLLAICNDALGVLKELSSVKGCFI